MTYRECYEYGRKVLKEALVPDADLDARLLLEFVCQTSYNDLLLYGDRIVEEEKVSSYKILIQKRRARVPLQQITGEQYFCGYPFYVNQNVLTPRADTEILVEEALKKLKTGDQILDMCTGSGCILLSLLLMKEGCAGVGVDLSEKALQVAEKNRRKLLSVETECRFLQGDLFAALKGSDDTFSMLVSNPPYIRTADIEELMPEVRDHEPRMALDGEEDGLSFYRRIAKEAKPYLKKGGYVLFEIGFDQKEQVCDILTENGYREVEARKDYAGLYRVVMGRWE